jgi:hypothetical protein
VVSFQRNNIIHFSLSFLKKNKSFHVSPATRKGKRLQLLQMLLLPFIPIMALVIQNAMTVGSY